MYWYAMLPFIFFIFMNGIDNILKSELLRAKNPKLIRVWDFKFYIFKIFILQNQPGRYYCSGIDKYKSLLSLFYA
jgi:hypothetical protein